MIKYLIYLGIGYIVFKVAKNGLKYVMTSYQDPKELTQPTDLVRCSQCDSHVSAGISLKKGDLNFCSEDCLKAYQDSGKTS